MSFFVVATCTRQSSSNTIDEQQSIHNTAIGKRSTYDAISCHIIPSYIIQQRLSVLIVHNSSVLSSNYCQCYRFDSFQVISRHFVSTELSPARQRRQFNYHMEIHHQHPTNYQSQTLTNQNTPNIHLSQSKHKREGFTHYFFVVFCFCSVGPTESITIYQCIPHTSQNTTQIS